MTSVCGRTLWVAETRVPGGSSMHGGLSGGVPWDAQSLAPGSVWGWKPRPDEMRTGQLDTPFGGSKF